MALWECEVAPTPGAPDPVGMAVASRLRDFGVRGVEAVRASRLYLFELQDAASAERATAERLATSLLCDPVAQTWSLMRQGERDGVGPPSAEEQIIEVHLRPGVMDPVAHSTLLAMEELGASVKSVRTARRYVLTPSPTEAELRRIGRLVGNDCIEVVTIGARPIEPTPKPTSRPFALRRVPLAGLDCESLAALSRRAHLFLSVEEMRAISAHFRDLGRDPTDLELETLAQTWSEHCVHKTLKSAIVYRGEPMPSVNVRTSRCDTVETEYDNLLADTIARATRELVAAGRGPFCLSVFKDNAGVIAWDEAWAVAFKVETHNHPSAIEPYGGAATGVGGVIRDVLGCGLGAQPIAGTDVFCLAPPDWPVDRVPRGVIHPRLVLEGVVAGVRDYGNRMGIPTVSGALHFDARYLGNPLVYCGCVGLLPRDRIEKQARPGDLILLMGGRTGRDGIHGATFSSAELSSTHEQEFGHAVQIGNAIEEKKLLDVILQMRDFDDGSSRGCLFSAITDCGAGGLSSAIGEMAAGLGAEVQLERVPLKYEGLRYDEIWISEAQERMVLAVPPKNLDALLAIAAGEDVEASVIGRFTDSGRLVVRYADARVGDLDLRFLHEGLPRTRRAAVWRHEPEVPAKARETQSRAAALDELSRRLSHPTTASKHWIVRQYDHEVQGRTVIGPLVGPGDGPSDAAVLRPLHASHRGIAIGCGLAPHLGDLDPYLMAFAAIDEALRNVVCVGGDPSRTAILDNFCWPRADDARHLGALVRACQACYDVATAYGLPFISGKDSLNNEIELSAEDAAMVREAMTDGRTSPDASGRLAIPYTLLISALSIVEDVRRCVTMDLKTDGGLIYLLGEPVAYETLARRSALDLESRLRTHRLVAELIAERLVVAVHDASESGPLTALAEMCIAAGRSCQIDDLPIAWAFIESPALYLVEVPADRQADFTRGVGTAPAHHLGRVVSGGTPTLCWAGPEGGEAASISTASLRAAWTAPLDR